jgi:sRNA-binding regulator protein Hfq
MERRQIATLYLRNRMSLRGRILEFDAYVFLLEPLDGGPPQMVYKSAVVSVSGPRQFGGGGPGRRPGPRREGGPPRDRDGYRSRDGSPEGYRGREGAPEPRPQDGRPEGDVVRQEPQGSHETGE